MVRKSVKETVTRLFYIWRVQCTEKKESQWVRKAVKKAITNTVKWMVMKTIMMKVKKTMTRLIPADGRGFHSDHTLAPQTPPPLARRRVHMEDTARQSEHQLLVNLNIGEWARPIVTVLRKPNILCYSLILPNPSFHFNITFEPIVQFPQNCF